MSRRATIRTIRRGDPTPPWVGTFRWTFFLVTVLALAAKVIELGYKVTLPPQLALAARLLDYLLIGMFLANDVFSYQFTPSKRDYFRRNWLDILILIPIVIAFINLKTMTASALVIGRQLVVATRAITLIRGVNTVVAGLQARPAQLLAISFALTIALGTLLLTFPAATSDQQGTPFLDALFTATSATCVTGLIVRDTPVYFSLFGELVILSLIQIGGLGIMTFSTSLTLIFGRRLGLKARSTLGEMLGEPSSVDIAQSVIYIFRMTMFAEAIGTIILFLRWMHHFDTIGQAFYVSLFHAVSAFCNAGFSLFSSSLEGFKGDPLVNAVICILIVAGGLGFVVVAALVNRDTLRRGFRSSYPFFSVHTRLVLTTTLILVIGGTILFFYFEFDNSLHGLGVPQKMMASLFQSITARTAGFNTVTISDLRLVTILMLMALMFIGASPGSTGGGIKTTTTAILLLSVKSMLTGRRDIEIHNRTIPQELTYRSVGIAVVSLVILTFFFGFLLAFQPGRFEALAFEAVSAFGTVGLSMGVTPDLSFSGKFIIICLMYAGRIGPLTIALAIARPPRSIPYRYPTARVMVG
jgi:trk system potassium uptake protein TrkH